MSFPKKFLFIPLSSPGYLFPAIRLAKILEGQGNTVKFATTKEYQLLLQCQGFDVQGIHNDGITFLHPSAWFNAGKAVQEIRVLEASVQEFKPDVIVTNPLVLAAFVLAERHQLPLLNLGFAEYLYPNPGRFHNGKQWRIGSVAGFYNQYRAQLDLPPVDIDPENCPLIGDCHLLRNSPELYGEEGLPSKVKFVGDLYWEPEFKHPRMMAFVERQQAAGRPVVYVQIGRLFEDAPLWERLLALFGQMDAAFVVDTGRADYLRPGTEIPQNCFLAPFIPLGPIAEHVAFVLFTGQSTAAISGILHGKPLLSLPHSADAHEFTQRLEARQLATGLYGQDQWNLMGLKAKFDQVLKRGNHLETAFYRQTLLRYDDALVYQTVIDGLA